MADNTSSGSGGAGPVAMVAIVILVLLAIGVGYYLIGRGGVSSAAHSFQGSVQTPAGPITGHGSVH